MNKIYRLSVALLLAPLVAIAQPQTLTLEQCREMAIESSHTLHSSLEKIEAAEDMFKAYRANNLPNFSLSGGYLYSTASLSETIAGGYLPTFTPDLATGAMKPNIVATAPDGTPIFGSYAYMPDMNFDFEVGSVFNAGIKATQPIYLGGKVATATKLAKVGMEAATIDHSRLEAEVAEEAERAFFTYIKVEELLQSAESYQTTVEEFYRQVESLLSSGMCTKNDLLRVQVKLSEAELNTLKAKNGLVLARMNLCHVVGLPLTTREIDLVDTFNLQLSVDPSLDVTSRSEYALLEKSIEAKELQLRLAKSDMLPSVSAIASYSYTNGLKLNSKTLFDSTPSFTGGVVVDIPLFHWGEQRRKVSAARREVTIAENTKSDLVQKMTLELMQSINAYNEAQAEVSLMERTLEQAQENLRQSTKRYTAGMETLSNQLEAQTLWQKAMSDLVEAKSNQRLAYLHYTNCR